MLPDPLHPAVVHFPIVLMYLAPVVTAFVLWRLRVSETRMKTWVIVPVLLAAVTVSGFVARQTGEEGEDLAEQFVDHDTVERHEEQANLFVWFSLATVVVAAAAFAAGPLGSSLRILTLILTIVGAVLVTRTGHSGGTMVYDHMIGASATIGSETGSDDARHDD